MLGRFATEALPLLGMRALTWQRHLDRINGHATGTD